MSVQQQMVAASQVWQQASLEARVALVKAPESPLAVQLRDAMRAARGERVHAKR